MGFFTNFFLTGFSTKGLDYYSPGELYEVMSNLGEQVKPEDMRRKVCSLLDGWYTPTDTFRKHDNKVPAYALELHAINEKNNVNNGYGTYVFVPDEREKMVIVPLTSIFSKPRHIYDDEDPLKILADKLADEDGFGPPNNPVIYELTCDNYDYYPLNTWKKELANDPLEEVFGVLDDMKADEYAGFSIVVIPPEDDWQLRGRMHIRAIEDPEYREVISPFETLRRFFNGEPMPEEEADRLAGYAKQQLDPNEKAEIEAISEKINGNAFRCTIRVYASSTKLADDLAGIIIQKMDGRYNSLEFASEIGNLRDLAQRKEGKSPFIMSDLEIASLWHVPAENTGGEKRRHPLPAALTPPEDLIMVDVGGVGDVRKLIMSVKP